MCNIQKGSFYIKNISRFMNLFKYVDSSKYFGKIRQKALSKNCQLLSSYSTYSFLRYYFWSIAYQGRLLLRHQQVSMLCIQCVSKADCCPSTPAYYPGPAWLSVTWTIVVAPNGLPAPKLTPGNITAIVVHGSQS